MSNKKNLEDAPVKIGDIVYGVVDKKTKKGIYVLIKPFKIRGFVSSNNISDITLKNPIASFKKGQKIVAKVISKSSKKFNLTLKQSVLNKSLKERENEDEKLNTRQGDNLNKKEEDYENFKANVWGDMMIDDISAEAFQDKGGISGTIKEDMVVAKSIKEKGLVKIDEEVKDKEIALILKSKEFWTSEDYENILKKFPNDPRIWIKYISFYIACGEIASARDIAERALITINYREEDAKLKVWITYIKLEILHNASIDAAMMLFRRALHVNDQKKLYINLLTAFLLDDIRSDIAEEIINSMQKKFNDSAKVHLKIIEYWLKKKNGAKAKDALSHGLKHMHKRKHLKVLSGTGILEFKFGNAERGRDIFEAIVSAYPKRIDYWNLYIDQEIKLGEKERIRMLLERAINLKIHPKKMKLLFKRYMVYETEYGTKETIEKVKAKALDYVKRNMQ